MKFKKFIWPLIIIVLWQGLYNLNIVSDLVFPSFIDVLKGLFKDITTGELPKGMFYSLFVIVVAFIPSMITGFIMAFLSYRFSAIDKITQKLSAIFHPLPGIALLPLLIIWSGLGLHIIILIVIHSVLWPFYINIRSGFLQVPKIWIDLSRNNHFNKREELLYILLPGAFPSFVSGLKIAWARAWRAVISAEMIYGTIGGTGGLGWYIFNKRIFMDSPGIYGGIIFLIIIGLLIEGLFFEKLETNTSIRWGNSHELTRS